jgi:hypothetical protein
MVCAPLEAGAADGWHFVDAHVLSAVHVGGAFHVAGVTALLWHRTFEQVCAALSNAARLSFNPPGVEGFPS